MVDVSELAPLAKQLNEKTNQINSTLSTVNQKLAKLNLGIEIYLDDPLTAEKWEDDFDTNVRSRRASYLGYDCPNDEWELSVKTVTEEIQHDRVGREYTEEVNPDYQSLLKCSRALRLEALEQLPHLLAALKRQGEQILKSIEAGEKVAKSL